MSRQQHKVVDVQLANVDNKQTLSSYPIDMSSFLALPHYTLDARGIPFCENLPIYDPSIIAQYALGNWNQYCATKDERYQNNFLVQAYWLVEHEVRICDGGSGWLISFTGHADMKKPLLSARVQGVALSVLLRAYQLTQETAFLDTAHRTVKLFMLDILDGGVSTPLGKEGIFFEEIAAYPASHSLNGCLFGLLGLYEYVTFTGAALETLLQRGVTTLHTLLQEFDVGFWTRSELLHRRLASPDELALQAQLLESLSVYSGCEHCAQLATRWQGYLRGYRFRLLYRLSSMCNSFADALLRRIRSSLFPHTLLSPLLRVCVPITAFPVVGGMCTVLDRVSQVTEDCWQLEYLTPLIGPHAEKFAIHRFSTAGLSLAQFPNVWFYVLAGFHKLLSLQRQAPYQLLFPQDGVFTSAFAGLVARIAGVRCVCIDHGNLGLLNSRLYRKERLEALKDEKLFCRLLDRLRYSCYWPSLLLLAWVSARLVDQYFIPGIAGDGVEEVCERLGVPPSRITRFANMINIERHVIPDPITRANMREKQGIPANAIVITLVCRLAPEKGLEIAVEAISRALAALPPSLNARVRVLIVGDGPLRGPLEEDIKAHGLRQVCMLWGQASSEEVIRLLGLSDIFLFTSWRAAGYPLAILEAMASGCAVIACSEPLANEAMLAGGRGIVVPVGNSEQTAKALIRLVSDQELRHQMGLLARNYVAVEHSPRQFQQAVLRVTGWSDLDALLLARRGVKPNDAIR